MSVENLTSGVMPNAAAGPLTATPVMPKQPVERVQAERVLPTAKATSQNVSQKELDQSIEQIQVMMDLRNRSVEFTTDESSGARVVKVVDSNSGDVIRQMPAEELLSFMRNLTRMLGTFIDKST
jgi:flagellar protein FlaG|tara:strand:+ start:332 stop:703 length:372 start_codon:yes stop_codon:yes gene_type:complete